MDASNWRPEQGCNLHDGVDLNVTAGGGWRAQLRHDDRSRMARAILETLKEHMSAVAQPEGGLNELQRIAVLFEDRIYTTATSQFDYLYKISSKMRNLEMGGVRIAPVNAQVIPNQNNPGQGLPL